jgi:hypothetical protein
MPVNRDLDAGADAAWQREVAVVADDEPGPDAGGASDAATEATSTQEAAGPRDALGAGTSLPSAPPDAGPWLLSQTGLYRDIATATLAPGVIRFSPAYPLWSDGADKDRFVALPAGTQIDTSDMDHWRFPVGTRLWKEFRRDGHRLETRLIQRTGPGKMDYWMGAFLWNADGSDAAFVEAGAQNVHGTDHDVPEAKTCWSCHLGEPGRVLGLSAIQLSQPPEGAAVSVASLTADGWLSTPPLAGTIHGPPGTPVVSAALGTLHANCGSCHNPDGIARPDTDLMLRLSVADRDPAATAIYRSTVGVVLQKFKTPEISLRVAPGSPSSSGIYERMHSRDPRRQMPPLASKHVDEAGCAAVAAWITSLPPPP